MCSALITVVLTSKLVHNDLCYFHCFIMVVPNGLDVKIRFNSCHHKSLIRLCSNIACDKCCHFYIISHLRMLCTTVTVTTGLSASCVCDIIDMGYNIIFMDLRCSRHEHVLVLRHICTSQSSHMKSASQTGK